MLQSIYTNGFLAAVPSSTYPKLSEKELLDAVTSNSQDPREGKARSCFVLERVGDGVSKDKSVRYGEQLYIILHLPGLEKPLYLASEPNTPTNQRWGPNSQLVYLTFEKGAGAIWYF
jgi:hypothetical protein